MLKTLFICKEGEDYRVTAYGYFRKFSGLFNSARFVVKMLQDAGYDSAIETALDNNCIDRLVTLHKPDVCVIEAYWVVPEKFEILAKLHPRVKWLIRIHSEVPFWATEGVAMDWTLRYLDYPNTILAPNAKRLFEDVKTVVSTKYGKTMDNRVVYLPNFYPADQRNRVVPARTDDTIHVGCFGAVRPLKNQLIQAIAAIKYADLHGKKLRFHINGNRMEGGGEPVLKNIRKLFEHATNGHELVEHPWQPHSDFLDVVATMDIGMQVSYTESFNIVSADMVTMNIPVVTSSEVSWVSRLFHSSFNETDNIVAAMHRAMFFGKFGTWLNRYLLHKFSTKTKNIWINYFR